MTKHSVTEGGKMQGRFDLWRVPLEGKASKLNYEKRVLANADQDAIDWYLYETRFEDAPDWKDFYRYEKRATKEQG